MSRNTKWKLAIIAGISECLVYAEAKYCAFQIDGEPKYYVCPRTEYCCNFGCCVSPGYQIYHLWYYWLLVIIMFLVCSGGGWWYRYWLQGRYRAAASAIPTRSSSSRSQNPLRGPTCQAQQARISYNTARNTVLLHRMWKDHHRVATPAYSAAGAASSGAAHYQNTSVVLNDVNCPYYQLYGPPPSYETVIAQTRNGKMSNPSSPELLRTGNVPGPNQPRAMLTLPPPVAAPSSGDSAFLGQCYYNTAPQYQPPPRFEGFDTAEYVRLMQQYAGNPPPTIVQSPRHQLLHQPHQFAGDPGLRGAYDRSSIVNTSKSSDNSDGENTMTNCSQINSPDEGGFVTARMNCYGSSCALDRPLHCYVPSRKSASRASIHGLSRQGYLEYGSPNLSQVELEGEPIATTSSSFGIEGCSSHRSRTELRKIQGGSLRIPRRRDHQAKYQDAMRCKRRLSSTDYELPSSSSSTSQMPGTEPQPSPSSNVILAANSNSKSTVVDRADDQPNDHQQHQQQERHPTSPIAERSSTNVNPESKRKLDRSRSLE